MCLCVTGNNVFSKSDVVWMIVASGQAVGNIIWGSRRGAETQGTSMRYQSITSTPEPPPPPPILIIIIIIITITIKVMENIAIAIPMARASDYVSVIV